MKSRNPAIFFGAIVLAIIFIAGSVYYALPGYDHFLTTHDSAQSHPTHAVLFGGLAVLAIIAALIMRPKKSAQ